MKATGTTIVLGVIAAVAGSAAAHRDPKPARPGVIVTDTAESVPVFVIPPIVSAPLDSGTVLLRDDFDGENRGIATLMYHRFRNWEVVDGTVDPVGAHSDWDFLPGNGLYVDLDGDRPDHVHFQPGALVSREAFELVPGDYVLAFRLAGSHRGDRNTTTVTLGGLFREEITLESGAPFSLYRRVIHVRRAATAQLRFENAGADGFGLLLDNVKLVRAETATGTVLLEDHFDGENDGRAMLVYTQFANWRVEMGSVDLIGHGSRWDYYPGNGMYVDLDGTPDIGGRYDRSAIVSRRAFHLRPGTYELSFRAGGSQRRDANTMRVSLGTLFREEITLPAEAPLHTVTRRIRVRRTTDAQLRFEHDGGDASGIMIDDVKLVRGDQR
jgi:hypothetical protein